MSYLGFPFPAELQSFTTHAQVQDYLCSYVDHHALHPILNFGCTVDSVRPILPAGTAPAASTMGPTVDALGKWEVVYRKDDQSSDRKEGVGILHTARGPGVGAASIKREGVTNGVLIESDVPATSTTKTQVAETFDAVCVCNGHYADPFTPRVEGADGFRGTCIHAREYDNPDIEAFVGKRVLCVGSRSSGTDIARELSSTGEVYRRT